jgi:hypothetical protein
MSFTILGNQQSDVLQGAQITLTQLFETFPGSGQGAPASGVTVTIAAAATASGGTGTPVATTSTGVVGLDGNGLFQYVWSCPAGQSVGDYLVTWSGTVGGTAVNYVWTVTVAEVASGSPAPGVYATVAAYRAWSGDQFTPDDLVCVTLQRASEAMDHYLIGAVYATNANGMPTDPLLIDVLSRATSAQCQFMLADNDPTGVKRQYGSTSMGGVSTSRVSAMTAMTFPPLAPQAAAILHAAGVLGSAALINW